MKSKKSKRKSDESQMKVRWKSDESQMKLKIEEVEKLCRVHQEQPGAGEGIGLARLGPTALLTMLEKDSRKD